jgi:hypothetical protein
VILQEDAARRTVSNAQLETVAYALQRFYGERLEDGSRAGFFLGDGAGVGKGRQVAALIKEMWRRGTRRILWLSRCNDLREDARRDMMDLRIHVPGGNNNMAKSPVIDVWPKKNSTPPAGKQALNKELPKGIFFATYNLLTASCEGVMKNVSSMKKQRRCVPASALREYLAVPL